MSEVPFIEEQPARGRQRRVPVGATIGREGCDVVLPDPDVSRRHAILRGVGDGLAIEDLESTNGTFVNGERVFGVTALKEGDAVRFGNTVWRVLGGDGLSGKTHMEGASPSEKKRADSMPSAIRRTLPTDIPPAAAAEDAFNPPSRRSARGSAARRVDAAVASYLVVLVTAIAVVAYLVGR